MKSPFAAVETETYSYPEPMKLKISDDGKMVDNPLIDQEVLADLEQPGVDPIWVKFEIPRSKGANDSIADYTQTVVSQGSNGDGATFQQRLKRGNAGIFALLVKDWSAFFEGVEPSGAAYDRLELWTGVWIDACLTDAMARGQASIAKKVTPTSESAETSLADSTAVSD